jgi:hypothetical protein
VARGLFRGSLRGRRVERWGYIWADRTEPTYLEVSKEGMEHAGGSLAEGAGPHTAGSAKAREDQVRRLVDEYAAAAPVFTYFVILLGS